MTRQLSPTPAPSFREMDPAECEAILARNAVARMAYAFHDRVDIVPVHYVYDGGWIYGRTTPGPKIIPIRHNHWVAIEVDEPEGVFEWRSVVVRGGLYFLEEDGPPAEREARRHALHLLERIIPETGSPADPVPWRTKVFRVHVDEMSGREARRRP